MKSAKTSSADTPSSRRSQPVRQTRTNPPRVSSGLRGSANGRDPLTGGSASDQPIDIFPAITYFSDAIAALPKELVRHFTLLKEVDAKIFAPEDALFQLVDAAMNAPPPQPRPLNDASSSVAPASAPMSAQNSSSGVPLGAIAPPPAPSTDGSYATSIYDPSNLPRRQLFRQTAIKIQEMLGSLEEKNHVISTANDALQKQLARIDDVWPHVETEFSDEAKWGSNTHWAYPENRAVSKAAHAERSRREGAAAISAAAQQLADEAAARSDARKQAVQAKKNQKTQHQDTENDDAESRPKAESGKKGHGGGKVRKAAEAAANVGLGISTNGTTNGTAPQPKRRKVEKTPSGNNVPGAMSTVFGNNASKTKTTSPRETPAPEGQGPKKRKALPSGTGQAKKSKNGVAAMSPSVASSPVLSTFPEPPLPRGSPVPTAIPVPPVPKPPTASRAKQSTTTAAVAAAAAAAEGAKQSRPTSSASIKPNGAPPPTPEVVPLATTPKPTTEPKPATKEPSAPPVPEVTKKEPEPTETAIKPSIPAAKQKKETPKPEEPQTPVEPPPVPQTITAATVTKSGRASKPSTPAMATFQEAARPKSARNTDGTASKRKKSNAVTSAKAPKPAEDAEDSEDAEEAEIRAKRSYDYTEDEPTYCYCTSVSYGEMVACDANNCEREWFHLNCVGLKVAPKGSSKWYCEECVQRFAKQGKKLSHKYNLLPDAMNVRKQRGPQY